MDIKDSGLCEDSLEKVSGDADMPQILGGKSGIWNPVCPSCGKVMKGGADVIRVQADGYESHYQKYEKSTDSKTGKVIYGWKKI